MASAVPGIKQVDAKWAELERQREGLQRGGTVFDTGKTATRPADLAADYALERCRRASKSGLARRLCVFAKVRGPRSIGSWALTRTT